MSEREAATGELGLIQAFVNTVDLMPGVEELRDPNTLKDWLVARRLMDAGQPVDESDLKHALAVREAMRGLIAGNSGQRIYPVDLATLNEAAIASRLRMRFGSGGKARLDYTQNQPIKTLGYNQRTLKRSASKPKLIAPAANAKPKPISSPPYCTSSRWYSY